MKQKEKENRRKTRKFRNRMKYYLIGGKIEESFFWLLTSKIVKGNV